MASTGLQQRLRFLAMATIAATLLVAMILPRPAALAAANPGGTAAGGSGGGTAPTSSSSKSKPSAPASSPHKAPAASSATTIKVTSASCVPSLHCSSNPKQVSTHGSLLLKGQGLTSGMVVAFPRAPGAHISRTSPTAHLHKSTLGLVVTVPKTAHSGHLQVMLSGGRSSSSFGPVTVVHYALHPPAPKVVAQTTSGPSAFDGQGMWIWYIEKSDGGNLASIVAQAHAAGVTTLYIKSSDGSSNYWSQFSAEMVSQLHANGLKVCAWQYVYGSNPAGEAALGARAVEAGADCLVIDAEAEYEGKYGAAQTYLLDLRAKVGAAYPLGLASFPYVDYHPSFPYSVFLGPNGAQFNAPQMYWKAIGTSVATVFAHTYQENLIYGRPIFPLGQTYENPSAADLVSFRSLAAAYGAQGTSWWDWQETASAGWTALASPLTPGVTVPSPELTSPLLKLGAKGDQVLWLQEHLASAIPGQPTSGVFDSTTQTNLESFQTAHGIPASGETDASSWAALLALAPVAVDWTGTGPSS